MLFEQTTVGEFVKQTLVCPAEAPIQDVLELLQQPSAGAVSAVAEMESANILDRSQIVVVDAQQQPISLIPLAQFLHLFVAEPSPSVLPQQPIMEWVHLHHSPLQRVSERDSLKQFWQYLQTFSQDLSLSWAIVEDVSEKYLGLLDTRKLVQFLAHHAPLSVAVKFSSDLKSTVSPVWELSDPSLSLMKSAVSVDTITSTAPVSAELLAEISHELKSPLTAVVSLSNVLSHQGMENLSARQQQYIQLIHQKSQQLMGQVNTLLDLTHLSTQSQLDRPKPVDLEVLCDDAIAQAKRLFTIEQGIAAPPAPMIHRHLQETLAPLSSHELKLRQILVHLLHNALGFTQGQSPIELEIQQWQGWTVFTIADQGGTIPPLQQPLIFQIPQSWTETHRKLLSKTGLGLVLAQRLAEQLSGDISFISGPGQGNTFSFYLPPSPSQSIEVFKGFVLVIATNLELIQQVSQFLYKRSLQVIIARSALDVPRKITTFKPQAIVLQTQLTTGSGWELLSTLQQLEPKRPLLLMGNKADCPQATAMAVGDYVTLPTLQPGLAQWVKQWLEAPSLSPTANFPQTDLLQPDVPSSQQRTVLHIDGNLTQTDNALPADLSHALYEHQWRVISTTTMDEAELLAKIWKPHAILYTATDSEPFKTMTPESPLTLYPFIILHSGVYQVASERADLTVFAYAGQLPFPSMSELSDISSLLSILNNFAIAQ